MTTTYASSDRDTVASSDPSWQRAAGILILVGGILLTAATVLEITTDVSAAPATGVFWVLFLASTIAPVGAMFPLALGRGDGRGAVGMSTAPEVILARMLGLKVWACSSITNMGAGLSDENISHEHTKTMAVQGAEKLKRLIPALLEAI